MSHVMCHMSRVKCFSFLFLFLFLDKVLELVGGGSVINGPTPSSLSPWPEHISCLSLFAGCDCAFLTIHCIHTNYTTSTHSVVYLFDFLLLNNLECKSFTKGPFMENAVDSRRGRAKTYKEWQTKGKQFCGLGLRAGSEASWSRK